MVESRSVVAEEDGNIPCTRITLQKFNRSFNIPANLLSLWRIIIPYFLNHRSISPTYCVPIIAAHLKHIPSAPATVPQQTDDS